MPGPGIFYELITEYLMTYNIRRGMFENFFLTFALLTAFLLSVSSAVYGQAGAYYDAINTSSATLVSDLKTRIRSPYTKVSYDNFDETNVANFAAIDNGNGTKSVFCVYSNYEYIYSGTFAWGTMSREHTFCHSWMPTYSSTSGNEYSDQHHLFPTHQNGANGVRSNHPLGIVSTVTSQFLDGKYGTNSLGQMVYEPRDRQKGNAARAILYMFVRYDDVGGYTWNMNWLNNTRLPSLSEAPQSLATLISWHKQDPPDKNEIDRMNYIQSIQGNRNPFVDHPEYVNYINFNDLTKLSPTYSTEPTNYPTALTTSTTSSSFTVNWTDAATGTQAPSGYLVQIYSSNNYFLPVDGETYADDTNLSDGKGIVNVDYSASNTYTFNTGLSAGTTYYVTIYSYNGTGTSRNYKINSTLPQVNAATASTSGTVVNFVSSSATVNENGGTVTLTVGITNPSATNATTAQIALTSGTAVDLNNYSTQTVTFPANSSANQTVTVTVTDDALGDGDENFVFTLQSASGGTSATAGMNSTYTLTVIDNDVTSVQFTSASATVGEASGTYNLTLSITNPSPTATTIATVDLVSGDAADVGSYTAQQVTFPANSSANQTVTVTITNDSQAEPSESFEFSIETVTGGNGALAGAQSVFTLTVADNDAVVSAVLLDNFNRANSNTIGTTPTSPTSLTWTETETVSGTGAVILSNQLKMSSSTAGREFAYVNLSGLSNYPVTLSTATGLMTWAFNMKHTRPTPSGFAGTNYGIAFVLAKSNTDLTTGTGYAVVHGNSGTPDPIRLIKFSGGLTSNTGLTDIVSGGISGNPYQSIKVVFDPSDSKWYLYMDTSATNFPNSDPRTTATLIGTGTFDNTYTSTSLPYLGCLWNHNTTGTEYAIFDDIYISDPGGVLPVELTSFTAKAVKGAVVLKWSTATEVNNYGFEVQKLRVKSEELRTPGSNENWEVAGFVQGYGNSNSEKSYSFTDRQIIAAGKYIYRLKQIDTDGKYDYSKEVEVTAAMPDAFVLFQNYPNPFNPGTVINYQLPINSKVTIKIFDILGNELSTLVDKDQEAGVYSVPVNFANGQYASGTYFYRMTATGENGEVLFGAANKMNLIK